MTIPMSLETTTNKRKRLIFRSWHRGMKEMDQIMGSFANKYVPIFSENDLDLYAQLLENSDPDIYDWICRRVDVPANKKSKILDLLLDYDYAVERSTGSDEARLGH
jgi:antitoxin CptB